MPATYRCAGREQRPSSSTYALREQLLDSLPSGDGQYLHTVCGGFDRSRCQGQHIAPYLSLTWSTGSGPRLVPGGLDVDDNIVALDRIGPAGSDHRLEQLATFGICGIRARGSFPVIGDNNERDVATSRVDYVARWLFSERVRRLASGHFFADLALELPHTDDRRREILR